MDTVITYLTLSFIVSFLLGSTPGASSSRSWPFTRNIRDEGSGNIGTTNAFRAMGKVGGALVFVLDFGKGLLSGWLAAFVFAPAIAAVPVDAVTPDGQLLLGIFGNPALNPGGPRFGPRFAGCTLGHIFSPWLKFKGGKGIAVAVGCLFVTFGVMGALLEIAVFAVVVAISRFVSAGSLAAAIVCPIFAAYYFLFQAFDPIAWVLCLVTALVVIWAHRGNIHRLATGTERRIGDKAKE